MAFSVLILAFPAAPGPNAQGANYMVVVWGGWLLLCLAYYALPRYGGACWFTGPRVTLELAPGVGIGAGASRGAGGGGGAEGSDEDGKGNRDGDGEKESV